MTTEKYALVVDDDPSLRKIIRKFLEQLGYTIVEAANGSNAIKLSRELNIDLITMDNYMEKENAGIETIKAIRSSNVHVPIVCISSSIKIMQETFCRQENIWFIEKPVNKCDLESVVDEVLAQKSYRTSCCF